MDIKEYIQNRLEEQRKWYEQKASSNKKLFMNYQKIVITLGALIPVVVGIMSTTQYSEHSGVVSAVISAIIAVVAGLDKLGNPHTNWYNYRATEEILKKEKYLFSFKVGPYTDMDDSEAEKLLVERVERTISTDISNFFSSQQHRHDEKQPPLPPGTTASELPGNGEPALG